MHENLDENIYPFLKCRRFMLENYIFFLISRIRADLWKIVMCQVLD